ncbi:hypothetical protein EOPP23_09855 [Endozoicomonas sp. OPT23]|nr:hypothetical protein [Endozoicomonas sp. OPT23]
MRVPLVDVRHNDLHYGCELQHSAVKSLNKITVYLIGEHRSIETGMQSVDTVRPWVKDDSFAAGRSQSRHLT